MIQDEDLNEIERLILQMERLEQSILEKKEQQTYMNEVVAEKQRQCQQTKEQHEEKVRNLMRQARRRRARQGGRPTPTVEAQELPVFEQRQTYPVDQDPVAHVDGDLLEEALGKEVRCKLLPHDSNEAEGMNSEERMGSIHQSLQERLDLIQCLNARLAEYISTAERLRKYQQAGCFACERAALDSLVEAMRDEVATLIDIEAPTSS